MRYIFLTFSLFLFNAFLSAQTVNIEWGEEAKHKSDFQGVIKTDNDEILKIAYYGSTEIPQWLAANYIARNKKGSTPVITLYDKSLKEIKSIIYDFKDDDSRFNSFVKLKNNIFLIYDNYDKGSNTISFFAQQINTSPLSFQGNAIKLGQFATDEGGFINKPLGTAVNFILSKDSSKFLLISKLHYEKGSNRRYSVAVFDEMMKKSWSKQIELSYPDDNVKLIKAAISNAAEIILTIKLIDNPTKSKILIISNNKQPKEIDLNVTDKVIQSLFITSDNNGVISFFSFYGDKIQARSQLSALMKGEIGINYDDFSNGFLIGNFNTSSLNIQIVKQENFPDNFIELVSKDANQGYYKKGKIGINALKFKEKVDKPNKTTDYIVEVIDEFEVEANTSSTNTSMRHGKYKSYQCGDIIIITLKEGSNSNFTRIPKFQFCHDFNGANDYFLIPKENDLYFFYNDAKSNVKKDLMKETESCNSLEDSKFIMTKVDENYNITREVVYDNKQYTVCTNLSSKISSGSIVLYALDLGWLFKGASDRLGVFSFK